LRESCTESSTTKSAKGSLHLGANPTHYRHASVYIQLLQTLRWRDEDGKLWKFQLHFSNSVPTYIEAASNWRQVHWLAKKVEAQEGTGIENVTALTLAITQWTILQTHIESTLMEKQSWSDKIFEEAMEKMKLLSSEDAILTYSPRMISPFLYVNANTISEKSPASIWAIELNPYSYVERLTMANKIGNKRISYAWEPTLNNAFTYWQSKEVKFQGFVATEFLLSTDEKALKTLNNVLTPGSDIIFVEPALSMEDFNEKCGPLLRENFDLISIKDISFIAHHQQNSAFDNGQ
jgi:hypothetical protein